MIEKLIPDNMNPWVCEIAGVKYSYEPLTRVEVPDEVAAVIDNYWASIPRQTTYGEVGQVWTKRENEAGWDDIPKESLATTETPGLVKMAGSVADASGSTVSSANTKINAIIKALVDAGIMKEYVAPPGPPEPGAPAGA